MGTHKREDLEKNGVHIYEKRLGHQNPEMPPYIINVVETLLDFRRSVHRVWRTSENLKYDSSLNLDKTHGIQPPDEAFWGDQDPATTKYTQMVEDGDDQVRECITIAEGFRRYRQTLEGDLTDRYKLGIFRCPELMYPGMIDRSQTAWSMHGDVTWSEDFYFGNRSEHPLPKPKPDIFYGMRMLLSDFDDLIPTGQHRLDKFRCRMVKFLADIRMNIDIQTSISNAFSAGKIAESLKELAAGKLRNYHTTCFPFGIVELKKEAASYADVEECYGQAANAAASALSQYHHLFRKTLWKDSAYRNRNLPPLVAFTCIGPTVKVWLIYAERNREELKTQMHCIYDTNVLLTWGVISLRVIIDNMIEWWNQVFEDTLKPALVKARGLLRSFHQQRGAKHNSSIVSQKSAANRQPQAEKSQPRDGDNEGHIGTKRSKQSEQTSKANVLSETVVEHSGKSEATATVAEISITQASSTVDNRKPLVENTDQVQCQTLRDLPSFSPIFSITNEEQLHKKTGLRLSNSTSKEAIATTSSTLPLLGKLVETSFIASTPSPAGCDTSDKQTSRVPSATNIPVRSRVNADSTKQPSPSDLFGASSSSDRAVSNLTEKLATKLKVTLDDIFEPQHVAKAQHYTMTARLQKSSNSSDPVRSDRSANASIPETLGANLKPTIDNRSLTSDFVKAQNEGAHYEQNRKAQPLFGDSYKDLSILTTSTSSQSTKNSNTKPIFGGLCNDQAIFTTSSLDTKQMHNVQTVISALHEDQAVSTTLGLLKVTPDSTENPFIADAIFKFGAGTSIAEKHSFSFPVVAATSSPSNASANTAEEQPLKNQPAAKSRVRVKLPGREAKIFILEKPAGKIPA